LYSSEYFRRPTGSGPVQNVTDAQTRAIALHRAQKRSATEGRHDG
jgi:hypothetical protein